jgi:hypothetical protein
MRKRQRRKLVREFWQVIALGCSAALVLPAQTPPSNWDKLQQLRPGDPIRVESRGAIPVTANFGSVSPEHLQLVRNQNQPLDLSRADVLSVYRLRTRSKARTWAPLIGAGIGFGAGFGIGYAADGAKNSNGFNIRPFISRPVAGGAVGLVGAVVGVTIGYFARGKSKEVVYRSR